jgi:hypothetical protein
MVFQIPAARSEPELVDRRFSSMVEAIAFWNERGFPEKPRPQADRLPVTEGRMRLVACECGTSEPLRRGMSIEKRGAIDRLRAYEAQIVSILDLLGNNLCPSRHKKARAQDQMWKLKMDLEDDRRRCCTAGSKPTTNAVETTYFYPAIEEAASAIRVKWNSNPARAWYSELSEALRTIRYFLRELEEGDRGEGPGGSPGHASTGRSG